MHTSIATILSAAGNGSGLSTVFSYHPKASCKSWHIDCCLADRPTTVFT